MKKFSLGQIFATPGALDILSKKEILKFVSRHARGDWGELCKEDKELNDKSLEEGGRLLSAYVTDDGVKLWIITEWDRSITTILLPEEY